MSRTTDELPRLASPGSIAELSELMALAHAEARTVAVFGGGTAFDDHPPAPTPGLLIDMTGLAEVVDHDPDDATLRAGAGAKISALRRFTVHSGQEILADLPTDRIEAGSSLGGMIATAAIGPRHLHRPRLAETVLSVTTVGADGTIARTAEGLSPRLAGASLPALVAGSWGTRAIIVEAEIRLRRQLESEGFVWIPGAEAALELTAGRTLPDAVEIERPPGSPAATVVMVEGGADTVETALDRIVETSAGAQRCARPRWWGRRSEDGATIRLSVAPDSIPWLLDEIDRLEDATGYPLHLRGSASGRFEVGIGTPGSDPSAMARVVFEHLRSFGLHRISARLLRAQPGVWGEVDAWGPLPGRKGLQETKTDCDPQGLLAPGRGIGGI